MEDYDTLFNKIIQIAIERANKVDCPVEEYTAQLRSWREEIQVAITAAGGD